MRRGVGMIIGLLALCTWALAQPAPDTVLPQRAADFWRLVAEAPTVQDSQLEALFSASSIERIGRDGLRDLLGQLHEDLGDTVVKLTPTLVQDQGGSQLQYELPDGRRLGMRLTLEETAERRIARFGVRFLPPAVPSVPALEQPAAIADHVRAEAAAGRFSGAVLVASGATPIQALAVGLADRTTGRANTLDTPINLGSMNKMFTAIAIGQLQASGRLDWSDRVGRHLPQLPNAKIRDEVSVEQLLTHTSGVGSYWNDRYQSARKQIDDLAGFLATFVDEPLLFEPGQGNEYSNGGPVILGLIIEAISGQSYYDYMREQLYEPAGMTHSGHFLSTDQEAGFAIGYRRDESGQWQDNGDWLGLRGSAAGGGYASANDLLAFAQALGDGRLLDRATLEQLWQARAELGPDFGYGYLFGTGRINGQRWVGHNGGAPGISADFRYYPDSGLTIIVLANQDQAAMPMSEWLNALLTATAN